MTKQLEALIAKIKKQTESFDTVVLKEDEAKALIAALEQAHHRGFMMACRHLEEHANVHYADAAEVEIAALRNRIAELEAKLETADKLQDSAFRHGLQHGFSYGQTNDQPGFEQAMRAYGNIRAYKRDDVIEAFRVAGGTVSEGE